MMRLEGSTVVDVPVEKVWEFLSDLEKRPQWDLEMHKVEYERPVGVGTTAVGTGQFFVWRTVNMTITDWEPNRKLGMQYRLGGLKGNDVFLIEAVEGTKTRLTRSLQAEFGGLWRLLRPLISYTAKKTFPAEVDRVGRIVEARNKVAI